MGGVPLPYCSFSPFIFIFNTFSYCHAAYPLPLLSAFTPNVVGTAPPSTYVLAMFTPRLHVRPYPRTRGPILSPILPLLAVSHVSGPTPSFHSACKTHCALITPPPFFLRKSSFSVPCGLRYRPPSSLPPSNHVSRMLLLVASEPMGSSMLCAPGVLPLTRSISYSH